MNPKVAQTPEPPYYAVIFTSVLSAETDGYEDMSDQLVRLLSDQEGFLGVESARSDVGITVSYWLNEASIEKWKEQFMHKQARSKGREKWYNSFVVRVAKVERDYSFNK